MTTIRRDRKDTEGSGASWAGGDGQNEDAYLVEDGLGLYVVCDGASDRPAGELAAKIAAGAVDEFVERAGQDLDLDRGHVARAVVDKAMHYAVEVLADAARSHARLEGLATTVTMLLAEGERGVIGHRGDSRAYLIREGRAHQLTVDHELTEAPESGRSAESDFDVFALHLEPGDVVVLCTDGAEEVVPEREIVDVAADLSPRRLANRIVRAAHRLDSTRDATAVVVRVRRVAEPGWLELSMQPSGTSFGHTLAVA